MVKFVRLLVHVEVISPCLVDIHLKYVFELSQQFKGQSIRGVQSVDREEF